MIAYQDLTDDFFCNEIKPYSRNADGRMTFAPTGKNSTLTIIEAQVCPVHEQVRRGNWAEAVQHALAVCREMRGFQGASNKRITQESIAKHVEEQAQKPNASFDAAVQAVIVGTESDGHGRLTSAATKMLQLFPLFSNNAIIYDSVVRKEIVARKLVRNSRQATSLTHYLGAVRRLFSVPIVEMPDESIISIDAYFYVSDVQKLLFAKEWVTKNSLQGFVRSRMLDRALWLMAAESPEEKARKVRKID